MLFNEDPCNSLNKFSLASLNNNDNSKLTL